MGPFRMAVIYNLKICKKLVSKKGHLALLIFLLTTSLNELKMIDNCILQSFQLFFNDFNVTFECGIKNILKFVKKLK